MSFNEMTARCANGYYVEATQEAVTVITYDNGEVWERWDGATTKWTRISMEDDNADSGGPG